MTEATTTASSTCRVCGKTVEVEGYETLSDYYRTMMDRIIVCPEHEVEEANRSEEEIRLQRRTIYRNAVTFAQIPANVRGKKWSDLDVEEPADVVEEDAATGETTTTSAADATASRKAALDACAHWSAGDHTGLILAGRVGIGKSWYAAVAAQTLIYQRVKNLKASHMREVAPIRWVTVPELIQKSRGDHGSDRRRDAEKILDGSFGLVLDDIDKVNPTQFSLDLLFEAIETRVNKGRPLLVTTNLGYIELREKLGNPLVSRLAGHCEARRMFGNDRRR